MKNLIPRVVWIMSLLSCSLWAQQPRPELTINYNPETAFEYPEARLVSEIRDGVSTYNNSYIPQLKDARQSLSSKRDPLIESRLEMLQQDADRLKASIADSKSQLAAERSRLASAKSTRAGMGMPECAQLPWGSSQKAILELMTKKGAKVFKEPTAVLVTFKGGTFAGFEASAWECRFVSDKLYQVNVHLSRKTESVELFREWNETVSKKYFVADAIANISSFVVSNSFRNSSHSSAADAARLANDLVLGRNVPTLQWSFAGDDMITLNLISTDTVVLVYANGNLANEKDRLQEKAKRDGQKDL